MTGIPRGFEMMAQSLIKMVGLDPAQVMGAIEAIRNSLQNSAGDLRKIREDQIRIMQHLGMEIENAGSGTDEDVSRLGIDGYGEGISGTAANAGTGN